MQHLADHESDVFVGSRYRVPVLARWTTDEDEEKPNFHTFPKKHGLIVKDDDPDFDFDDNPQTAGYIYEYTHNPTVFVQRWLYFEVLREVFWEVFKAQGKIFRMDSFTRVVSSVKWITTTKLREFLESWKTFEIQQKKDNPPSQIRRLIRIQQTLDRARHFVHSFLSVPDASTNPRWGGVDPCVTLSIMVLGETLSRANRQIRDAIRFNINGWNHHTASGLGWGYSKAVLENLKPPHWCKRKVSMMQALFKDNIIGLLHAAENEESLGWHATCSEQQCTSSGMSIDYRLAHAPNSSNCPCDLTGPNPEELANVLREGHVPLLRIISTESGYDVQVVKMVDWDHEYAIFSHVWTDGFGNPDANKMHRCILGFFLHLFAKIPSGLTTTMQSQGLDSTPEFFWIDTLAVPSKNTYNDESKIAVQKMHDIYKHAKYTIVLDRGLMQQYIAPGYATIAMRITMCGWMTRLWTLQEALLSRNIYFCLFNGLCPLDQLEARFEREDTQIHNCIPSMARAYYYGIIGTERYRLTHPDMKNERQRTTAEFVARVWKAAQWRTTTHSQHETLALATLLNLDTDPFSEANQTGVNFKSLDALQGSQEIQQLRRTRMLDRRMRNLLVLLARISPCPIPAGMIFLPGPRLPWEGFGWAPRTWLSSELILSPDPFSLPSCETLLELPYGLRVQYPGFVLHELESRNAPFIADQKLYFPIDAALHEWYRIESADEAIPLPSVEQLGGRRLAVIAVRLPVMLPKEIALLVSIIKDRSGVLDVEVENRVYLSRESNEDLLRTWRSQFRNHTFDTMHCGQQLPRTQIWRVDGRDEICARERNGYSNQPSQPLRSTKEYVDDISSHGPLADDTDSDVEQEEGVRIREPQASPPETWMTRVLRVTTFSK